MTEALLAISMVGRQRQLNTIRGWVSELAAGLGRAVLVEGEPGIGKSSLMRIATAHAGAAGCTVLWGKCDELSQAFPLLPLLDALGGNARVAEVLRADSAPGNRVDPVPAARS